MSCYVIPDNSGENRLVVTTIGNNPCPARWIDKLKPMGPEGATHKFEMAFAFCEFHYVNFTIHLMC